MNMREYVWYARHIFQNLQNIFLFISRVTFFNSFRSTRALIGSLGRSNFLFIDGCLRSFLAIWYCSVFWDGFYAPVSGIRSAKANTSSRKRVGDISWPPVNCCVVIAVGSLEYWFVTDLCSLWECLSNTESNFLVLDVH